MSLCFVSRTLGLQRIDSCRSQPVQAKETGGKAEATITMEGKRSKRVREGGEKAGKRVWGEGGGVRLKPGLRGGGGGEGVRLEEARFHCRTLGLIYGFTQTNPPYDKKKWVSLGRGLRGGE